MSVGFFKDDLETKRKQGVCMGACAPVCPHILISPDAVQLNQILLAVTEYRAAGKLTSQEYLALRKVILKKSDLDAVVHHYSTG